MPWTCWVEVVRVQRPAPGSYSARQPRGSIVTAVMRLLTRLRRVMCAARAKAGSTASTLPRRTETATFPAMSSCTSVARLRFARGDNDRDPLADIAHPPDRQRRPPGAVTLGAAHVLRHNLRVDCAQPILSPVLPGQHSVDAGHARRRRDSDRPDAGMRVRREEKDRIALARQIEVGDIAAAPGKKTGIFLAADRLSDAETAHLSPSRSLRSL